MQPKSIIEMGVPRVYMIGYLKASVLYLTSTCQILPFLCVLKGNSLNHGDNSIFMEFDATQMNRTLEKALEGLGFKQTIKILVN